MKDLMHSIRFYLSQSTYIKRYVKFLYFVLRWIVYVVQEKENFVRSDKKLMVKKSGFTGYYNKTIINENEDKLLFYQSDQDKCLISVLDLESKLSKVVARTNAWNFQQGAMAEFISNDIFIFNRFREGTLSAVLMNTDGVEQKEITNFPVQETLRNQNAYISLNYNNLTKLRPDYGYSRLSEWHKDLDVSSDGLWLVSYAGSSQLIVTLAELHKIEGISLDLQSKVNHVVASPSGDKILFLFRYFIGLRKVSCLYTYNLKSGALSRLYAGVVSHYCWVSEDSFAVWYRDNRKGKLEIRGLDPVKNAGASLETNDGHPVAATNGKLWFDSYPNAVNKIAVREIDLKTFCTSSRIDTFSKPVSSVRNRCDAHPKISHGYLVLDTYSSDGRSFGIFKI